MLAAACPAPAIDVSKRLRRQKRVRVALVSSVFEVVARLGKGWPKDRNAEEEGVLGRHAWAKNGYRTGSVPCEGPQ